MRRLSDAVARWWWRREWRSHVLSVPCHYCGAARFEPCRHTMLEHRPPTKTHQIRVDYAEEVPF